MREPRTFLSFEDLPAMAQSKIKANAESGRPDSIIYNVNNTEKRIGVMIDYVTDAGRRFFVQYTYDHNGNLTRAGRQEFV